MDESRRACVFFKSVSRRAEAWCVNCVASCVETEILLKSPLLGAWHRPFTRWRAVFDAYAIGRDSTACEAAEKATRLLMRRAIDIAVVTAGARITWQIGIDCIIPGAIAKPRLPAVELSYSCRRMRRAFGGQLLKRVVASKLLRTRMTRMDKVRIEIEILDE